MESLPTALFIHSYWKLMPNQFWMAKSYVHCLRTHELMLTYQSCHSMRPFYCGRRFGEHADIRQLTVCRQLLYSNETVVNYPGVPQHVIKNTKRYRSCLARIRNKVAPTIYKDVFVVGYYRDRSGLSTLTLTLIYHSF